jgi:hypothetical protein
MKKAADVIRTDLLNTALAIAGISSIIHIFYLIFLWVRTIEGEAISKQFPDGIVFLEMTIIIYFVLRFTPIIANNFRLIDREEKLFFYGNIFFGIGFVIFLLLLLAAESPDGTKALIPLLILTIVIPSFFISSIVYLGGLRKFLVRQIRSKNK